MSANDSTTTHDEVHTGPIKTPKQLLMAVFYSFVVPIFAIIGLVLYVTSGNKPTDGTDDSEKAVAQRIQKIGMVALGEASSSPASAQPAATASAPAGTAATPAAPAATPAAPAAPAKVAAAGAGAGEALYKQTCVACHAAGVAGAPKFGDKAAWEPRIKTGMDALVNSSIKGKNAMPPKGGSTASDADLKSAVEYMVNAAK